MMLTPQERDTHVFRKLMKHFNERLNALRASNDGPLDPHKTAEIRGRIAEVKGLIGLDKDIPIIQDE